ncbi:Glucan endo-1,3-beta-glucosidase A1-like protein 2 [Colletotrichum chlorophyti]|uniref:Glucan endo-1,3-beta-glucosidase A1-like protein 2 n=1 Tax=Colletotrichum chlorophyti TaxID=708187 RepID=A0A1Q8S8L8_9PEZI|nr:Glucan endo-1,3-beta-glucosidase A1-like protein 2 [Colletotrichum chlorophyti]
MSLLKLSTALLCLASATHAKIPKIRGFDVTWSDDFEGRRNTLPDPDNWIIDLGTHYTNPKGPENWGTGEIQVYTNDVKNVRVDGKGSLKITAIRNATGTWTSSRIETQRKDFMAQPGGKMRIQASLKVPNLGEKGIGYWPAFWTLGAELRGNYWNWPYVGELDIMENVNTVDRFWGVMHCDSNPGGACDEPNGIGNSTICAGGSCPGRFHTHTVEVDRSTSPEFIRWFIDGVQFHSVNQTALPEKVWEQTVHKPHFVLLNMAIGGGFPDGVYGSKTPTNATVSGGVYEAQYVAVYNSRDSVKAIEITV